MHAEASARHRQSRLLQELQRLQTALGTPTAAAAQEHAAAFEATGRSTTSTVASGRDGASPPDQPAFLPDFFEHVRCVTRDVRLAGDVLSLPGNVQTQQQHRHNKLVEHVNASPGMCGLWETCWLYQVMCRRNSSTPLALLISSLLLCD